MSEIVGAPLSADGTIVLSERPEGVLLGRAGTVVGIRRAPLHGAVLAELRAGFERGLAEHPKGLVCLTAYRLSPRFPLGVGFDSNTGELSETLRVLDRSIIASAHVLEFGGVRAAAMRAATLAVTLLARPRAPIASFDRLTDAIAWLRPHAEAAGVAHDPATFVALYAEAERRLAAMDGTLGDAPAR